MLGSMDFDSGVAASKCGKQHGENILVKYLEAFSKDMQSQFGAMEAGIYAVTSLLIVVGYHMMSDGIFSSIVTLASVLQLLGLVLTLVKVQKTKTFGILSMKSLQMYIPVYVLRLSCTLFNEGYLPVDVSGDWAYQTADCCCLAVVVFLLWKAQRDPTVQEEQWFPVGYLTVLCMVFALLCHPCHNLDSWSDVWWTSSVYLETFVMLPQLRIIAAQNKVESLTSHAIACTGVYRSLNFYFWFVAFGELFSDCCPSHMPAYFVVVALGISMIMLCDFLFYYMRALAAQGSLSNLTLPSFQFMEV